jgi:hypothetical protein
MPVATLPARKGLPGSKHLDIPNAIAAIAIMYRDRIIFALCTELIAN